MNRFTLRCPKLNRTPNKLPAKPRSPNIKQFLTVALPPQFKLAAEDIPDNTITRTDLKNGNSFDLTANDTNVQSHNFLPPEVEGLPHEAKDVLKRLLEIEPKQRIRSVLALQKIALYKNFKIDAKHLLSINPLDIITKDHITLHANNHYEETSSVLATEAFQAF